MSIEPHIQVLWFQDYHVCFIPKMHLEGIEGPYTLKKGTKNLLVSSAEIAHFKVYQIPPRVSNIYINNKKYKLDSDFVPQVQKSGSTVLIQAPQGVMVDVIRSFDVHQSYARFTGSKFISNGMPHPLECQQFAFASIRSGWQYIGYYLSDGERIGPVRKQWVSGARPTIKAEIHPETPLSVDFIQESPYSPVMMNIYIQPKIESYGTRLVQISLESGKASSHIFSDLMSFSRILFSPPHGFELKCSMSGLNPDSEAIYEYNSVINVAPVLHSVEEMHYPLGDVFSVNSPQSIPNGFEQDIWQKFLMRFPVTSAHMPILVAKGLDPDASLNHLYDFPNCLIQYLLMRDESFLKGKKRNG